jgi:hypothetical protein
VDRFEHCHAQVLLDLQRNQEKPSKRVSPDNWMATAHTVYANQTRGNAFTLVLAWKRVFNVPKWRQDQDDLTTPIPSDMSTPVPSSYQTDNGHPPSTPTIIGICTPSSRLASSIMHPMGQKAAKKHWLEGTNDNKLSAQAAELTQLSRD